MSLPELRVFLNILKNKSQELMSTLEIAERIKDLEIVYKSIQKLTNRASEFDGGSFLILVVGPVKSGKSTLVNLIAHAHVSPTHFWSVRCVLPSYQKDRKNPLLPSSLPPIKSKGGTV